jgi:hypothetical protein
MRPDHHTNWGDLVSRRFALILAAIVTTTSVVLAACNQTPAAPLLSDPKEILTETVVALKDLKTVEMTGSFSGAIKAAELGPTGFDLSKVTLSAALDVPGKKAKVTLDAPDVFGTKIDALIVGDAAYYKIAGVLAGMVGGSADKYTKTEIPQSSGAPMNDPAEIAKAVDEMKAALDKLPKPPTKGADEKCGDQDCYHVTIALTAADLQALDPSAGPVAGTGDLTFDLWSRHSDRLPAKLTLGVASPEMGTIGMTLEFRYGRTVSVEAPPADQIAP